MAFNFGNSSSGGGGGGGASSGGGLFGSNSNKPQQGSLFGNPSTTGAGFGFGGFGKPAATTGTEGQNTTTSAGPSENKPAAGSLFGSIGTPDRSSTTSPATTSAFGSTTPATTKPPTFSFASTTPAGPPPSTSAFGTSTGGPSPNLFGTQPADGPKLAPFGSGFSFGNNSGQGQTPFKPAEPKPSGFSFGQPSGPGQTPFAAAEPKPAGVSFNTGTMGQTPFKPADSQATAPPSVTAASGPEQKPAFSFPSSTPATSAPTTSQPAAAGPSFGFGGPPKPPQTQNLFSQPTASEAPKSTFSFAQSTAAPPSDKPASANSGSSMGSLFSGMGASTSTTTAAPMTSTAPAPNSNLFSFPPTSSAQPATTSASASSPFSFPPTASSQPTTTAAPAASPFTFAKPTTTASSQPAATSTAPGMTPFSAFGTTTSSAQPSTTTTAPAPGSVPFQASTTGPTPPAQSRLRNKTMDEILTRWATDMSRYSKEFKDHAEMIARWDQLIVDNSSKIDKLYVRTRTAERQTVSVDMQLTAVENSQAELEAWLTKYENDVDEMLAKDSTTPSELGGPDQERERTYKLAEKLGERLDEMEKDLGGMVEEVNAANASLSRNGKGDEPITQIVKILNSHLIQLQAIDQGTQVLQEKVATAQKAASQLGYLNGSSLNGSGGSAVQDFYRSYMGRRS